MRLKHILFLLSFVIIQNNLNADIMAELAKRDIRNSIRLLGEYSSYILKLSQNP